MAAKILQWRVQTRFVLPVPTVFGKSRCTKGSRTRLVSLSVCVLGACARLCGHDESVLPLVDRA